MSPRPAKSKPAAPPAPRRVRERRHGYPWMRTLTIAVSVAMISIGVAVTMLPPDIDTHFRGKVLPGRDRLAILALLQELKLSWRPADHAKVLERAVAQGGDLELAMHWILAQPTHRHIEQAIELAGAMRLPETRDDLLFLATRPKLRALALVAADRIEPLPETELDDLFEQGHDMQLLAIELAHAHGDSAVGLLLSALGHEDHEVRTATLAALPATMPAEALPQLLEVARDSRTEIAAIGLHALGAAPFTDESEQVLAAALTRSEPELATSALEALSKKDQPLTAATQVALWALIDDAATSRAIAAKAFLALERTGSTNPDDVRSRLGSLDDFGRYFACRLLAAHGESDAIDFLFDLVDRLDEPDQRELRFATLTLLGSLAHLPALSTIDELQKGLTAQPPQGPTNLPPPQVDF